MNYKHCKYCYKYTGYPKPVYRCDYKDANTLKGVTMQRDCIITFGYKQKECKDYTHKKDKN